ncbi:hypothetical protein FS837_010216 [Tulasnella sp. UAMH 9824]|nr:hypothetical protein FS837_010216 [Tulasnella sp. UAMH 9824]
MVITTRRTARKVKAVTYKEQGSDDDVQMSAKAEFDEHEPPMKKLRTGIDSSSPITPQQEAQGVSRGSGKPILSAILKPKS